MSLSGGPYFVRTIAFILTHANLLLNHIKIRLDFVDAKLHNQFFLIHAKLQKQNSF
jgi:hypothetical protein